MSYKQLTTALWRLVAEVFKKKKQKQIDDISQLCGFSFMFFCLMPPGSEKKKLKAELFVFKFRGI